MWGFLGGWWDVGGRCRGLGRGGSEALGKLVLGAIGVLRMGMEMESKAVGGVGKSVFLGMGVGHGDFGWSNGFLDAPICCWCTKSRQRGMMIARLSVVLFRFDPLSRNVSFSIPAYKAIIPMFV